MSHFGWEGWAEPTRHQVQCLLAGLKQLLAENLIGVYLHGSLAMGCFNPANSDIDLIVVCRQRIPISTKRSLVEMLLSISGVPHPIEISFLRQDDLRPWRYPTPSDLHYSEDWRKSLSEDLASGRWKRWDESPQTDSDLAAHITVLRERGICLWGETIQDVFPPVPHADYRASIVSDLHWLRDRLGENSEMVYGVLNSCRVQAYLNEGCVCSKEEGGVWALNILPAEFHPTIRTALEMYRGQCAGGSTIDRIMVERLIDYVVARVGDQ